jgi:hypothetical protein
MYNQRDDTECNHQVAQIGMISDQAERASFWLRPEKPGFAS